MKVLSVDYDTKTQAVLNAWPYDLPQDPVAVAVRFEVTRFSGGPSLHTRQLLPSFSDPTTQMQVSGVVVNDVAVPSYGSAEGTGVYVFERGRGSRSTIVLCTNFLSSPKKSTGCAHL